MKLSKKGVLRYYIQKRYRIFLLAMLIGTLSALAAVLLHEGLDILGSYLLKPVKVFPKGSGILWWFIFIPPLGAALGSILIYKFAPEAEGEGIDAVAQSFHLEQGKIRLRVPFIKVLASIFTMGSGGSGGVEGPIAQTGGGIGSNIARYFKLSTREVRNMLLTGCAGGLGAIFKAPLGGAISSIEIIYKEDFEAEALMPCVISSVTGYAVYCILLPTAFFLHVELPPLEVRDLLWYMTLGLVCPFLAYIFIRIFDLTKDIFRSMPVNRFFRPIIGAVPVAVIGLFLTELLGVDYSPIQKLIEGDYILSTAILILFGKMIATSLTVGSGASGGVFAPSLFIGAFGGGSTWLVLKQLFPHTHIPPLSGFVLVAMAAFFAATAKAPIGASIMVCEITCSFQLVAPLILVSTVSTLLSWWFCLYKNQAKDRFHSPAHLSEFAHEILASLRVENNYKKLDEHWGVPETLSIFVLKNLIKEDKVNRFPIPVIGDNNRIVGMLTMGILTHPVQNPAIKEDSPVKNIMTAPVWLYPYDNLWNSMIVFQRYGYSRIPVINEPDSRILGELRYQDIFNAYYQLIVSNHHDNNNNNHQEKHLSFLHPY